MSREKTHDLYLFMQQISAEMSAEYDYMGACARFLARAALLAFMILAASVGNATAQESRRTLDIRTQLVPIPEEQFQAAKFIRIPNDGPASDVVLPLKMTVQSISPISKSAPKAVVTILIENLGMENFSIPVSRELKVLHYEGNGDRRIFLCSVKLMPPANEAVSFGTVSTYSSSTDSASRMLLRRKESVELTYEADFERLWEPEAQKWHEGIAAGAILAAVECGQHTLTLLPDSARDQRRYEAAVSEPVRSTNTLRLSLRP